MKIGDTPSPPQPIEMLLGDVLNLLATGGITFP